MRRWMAVFKVQKGSHCNLRVCGRNSGRAQLARWQVCRQTDKQAESSRSSAGGTWVAGSQRGETPETAALKGRNTGNHLRRRAHFNSQNKQT